MGTVGRIEVVGDRPQPTRTAQRWRVVCVLALLTLLGWQLQRGEAPVAAFWLLVLVVSWMVVARPPTTVDADGIRRPWRWRRSVSWAAVEAVFTSGPGYPPWVRLRLTNGRNLTLDDIPADHAALVAEFGGKELRRPAPEPGLRPRPSSRERTQEQLTAEVERRARILAEQRAEMDAQASLRPRGIPRSPPPR